MESESISRIIGKHDRKRRELISILEEIQSKYGYLPIEALKEVSRATQCSLVDIYGIATFYKSFSLSPRGKHLVSVCMGTACHVRNAAAISEEFQRKLGIKPRQTTSDKEFTLEMVNCLGACALGPIVVVDGKYHSNVKKTMVDDILEHARNGMAEQEIRSDQRVFPVELSCPHCNHSLMDPSYLIDGHPSIRMTMSFGRKHGWIRLSSLYGSYTIASEHEIPIDTIVNCFCPHCHAELIGATSCPECGALMIPMIVHKGGMIQICSRRGCKNHMLDLDGVNF
ncbi:NAD(P)H-dependent oxidoreductase subunit E [candidate division KSB1 bacterium]|nr:NAD(P)H-dependent oxidoreductase subunit E [candidate division KSB1 bacterium]